VFIPYERYAKYLKWLTLFLLAYVAVVFVAKVDWNAAIAVSHTKIALTSGQLDVVVAIFGTTISPYLMFWQVVKRWRLSNTPMLVLLKSGAPTSAAEFRRIRSILSPAWPSPISLRIAIMMSRAATLHAQGKTDITTAADCREALGRSPAISLSRYLA